MESELEHEIDLHVPKDFGVCVCVHYSNSSTWAQVKGLPRSHSADVTCTVTPAPNAALHGTRTAPGTDTRVRDTSLRPRGTPEDRTVAELICEISVVVKVTVKIK